MHLARYKTAPPSAVRLRGQLIWLSPLPRLRLQQAEEAAAATFTAARCTPAGAYFEMARRAHVLASAISIEATELIASLSPAELRVLWLAWEAHQAAVASMQHPAAVREETRKRVNDTAEVIRDGQAAYLAATPMEFYGKPLTELTDAQIDYYTLTRAAFMEFHLGERTKEVSRAWLLSPSE